MQMFRLADIVVDPVADLAGTVTFEAHPNLQAAKAPRLLEPVNIVLVALIGLIKFVGKVRRLHTEGSSQAAMIFHQDGAGVERRIKPLVRIDGDGVGEFESTVAGRPLMRKQHATTIRGVGMQPHAFAIGNAAQLADVVDRARVRRAEDPDDTHGPDALFFIASNGILQRIDANLEIGVGRQGPECISSQTNAVDGLVDRDVAFFRRINSPTLLDSIVLCTIMGHGIATDFQADEVRHHAAAGEIAARLVVVAAEISQPTNHASFHGNRRGSDRICADVLIESRANEVSNNTDGVRRGSDQTHVSGMADVGAVGKQLLLQLRKDGICRTRILWQRLRKKTVDDMRLRVGEYSLVLEMLEVVGEQLDNFVGGLAKFFGVHGCTPELVYGGDERKSTPVLAAKPTEGGAKTRRGARYRESTPRAQRGTGLLRSLGRNCLCADRLAGHQQAHAAILAAAVR